MLIDVQRKAPLRAVVTTFQAIVQLEINLEKKAVQQKVIEQDLGVYFGLTQCDGRILVVARNLDAEGRVKEPSRKTNAICSLKNADDAISSVLTHENFGDLHQIRAIKGLLCVLIDEGSRLAFFDRASWQLVSSIDLEEFVPSYLRHEAPPERPTDPYHFNSLTFCGNRAFVLAHNWGYGSFVLELELEWGARRPTLAKLVAVHESLGHEAHNAIYDGGTLHVLDSYHGILIMRSRSERRIALSKGPDSIFPRGMALSRDYIIVCYGVRSEERIGRERSASRLCVLDRRTDEILLDVAFGNWGNPCDIVVTSTKDIGDRGGSFFQRKLGWLSFGVVGRRRRSLIEI